MSDKEDATKKPETQTIDEETLEKLAVEELMREAVQGAARAEIIGPAGWIKASPRLQTNKRFLVNTIRNAVSSNKYRNSAHKSHHHPYSKSPKRDKHPESSIRKERPNRRH